MRLIYGAVLVGVAVLALGAYRSDEMRAAAQTRVLTEFGAEIAEPPVMLGVTLCGARDGEIGQYFVARVRPDGFPPDLTYRNRAIGIVYADWRHVSRVEDAGFARATSFGTAGGLGCALPLAERLAQEARAELCRVPEVRELNPAACEAATP